MIGNLELIKTYNENKKKYSIEERKFILKEIKNKILNRKEESVLTILEKTSPI